MACVHNPRSHEKWDVNSRRLVVKQASCTPAVRNHKAAIGGLVNALGDGVHLSEIKSSDDKVPSSGALHATEGTGGRRKQYLVPLVQDSYPTAAARQGRLLGRESISTRTEWSRHPCGGILCRLKSGFLTECAVCGMEYERENRRGGP